MASIKTFTLRRFQVGILGDLTQCTTFLNKSSSFNYTMLLSAHNNIDCTASGVVGRLWLPSRAYMVFEILAQRFLQCSRERWESYMSTYPAVQSRKNHSAEISDFVLSRSHPSDPSDTSGDRRAAPSSGGDRTMATRGPEEFSVIVHWPKSLRIPTWNRRSVQRRVDAILDFYNNFDQAVHVLTFEQTTIGWAGSDREHCCIMRQETLLAKFDTKRDSY